MTNIAVTSNEITFSGNGTLAAYQQALTSVVYFNGAEEPSVDPVRQVLFQVYDGIFFSNRVTGFVNITLVDDNPPMLDCGAGVVTFTEGSASPVPLASFLTLSDSDADHVFTSASIVLTNPQADDEILVDASLSTSISVQSSSGTRVDLTGSAMAMEYQVRETLCLCCVGITTVIWVSLLSHDHMCL